jgi:hypothetical protein
VIAVWLVVWLLHLRKTMKFRPAPPQQQELQPGSEPEPVVASEVVPSDVPAPLNENEISWRDNHDK